MKSTIFVTGVSLLIAAGAHAATILNTTTFDNTEALTDGNLPGAHDPGSATAFDSINGWTWGTTDSATNEGAGVFAGLQGGGIGDQRIRNFAGSELTVGSGGSYFFGWGGSGTYTSLAQQFNGVGVNQTVTVSYALSAFTGMKLFVDDGSGTYADAGALDGSYDFNTTGTGNIRIALVSNVGSDSNTTLSSISVTSVPEPSAALLGGIGLLGLLRRRRA